MSDTEKLYVDNFLNSKKEFIEKRTEELLKALVALELEKREIDYNIKLIKAEAKDDGVDVNLVSKVFNRVKTRLRAKQEILDLEDALEEQLLANDVLIGEIKQLISPIVIEENE